MKPFDTGGHPPPYLNARLLRLVGIALVVALPFGAWRFFTNTPHGNLPSKVPDDDLPVLAGMLDAEVAPAPARDVLVVGSDEVYLARATDHTVIAVPKTGGTGRTLARIDGPIGGMALGGGALWLSTIEGESRSARRGVILKLGLRGGPPEVFARELGVPRAVASDGRWVFVVDVDFNSPGLLPQSALVRLATEGGPTVVMARCKGEVANIALDDGRAYWADRFDGTLVAVPKTGGEPQVLASDRGLPGEILVDGDMVYWVEEQTESLWAMPKTGGPPHQMAQDFAGFASLAADARSIWWVNTTAVDGTFHLLAVSKGGGDPRAAPSGIDAVGAIASDGTRIYGEHDGGVWPVGKK